MGMTHFVLVYDRAQRSLIRSEEFSDATEAAERYAALEVEHRGDDIEIVLVGSDSIETVKRTHGNYFGGRDRVLTDFLPVATPRRR